MRSQTFIVNTTSLHRSFSHTVNHSSSFIMGTRHVVEHRNGPFVKNHKWGRNLNATQQFSLTVISRRPGQKCGVVERLRIFYVEAVSQNLFSCEGRGWASFCFSIIPLWRYNLRLFKLLIFRRNLWSYSKLVTEIFWGESAGFCKFELMF